MRFKVGDIVTGRSEHNGYSITTGLSLLLVKSVSTRRGTIDVVVLAHNSSYEKNYIGDSYDVDACEFVKITIDEFYEKYPNCYKMETKRMNELLSHYCVTEEKEKNPYVLSEEARAELIEEMKTLLSEYGYHPTDKGLNAILDKWCLNKGDLIRLFEKHPNYNGRFQITFDSDFDRLIDNNTIYDFAKWLRKDEVRDTLLKEIQIGIYSYKELYEICERLNSFIRIFNRNDGVKNINGKTLDDFNKEYWHFKGFKDKYDDDWEHICIYDRKAYDMKSWNAYNKIDDLYALLTSYNYVEQFVNDNAKRFFENYFSEAKIRKGQKMSRAIHKILSSMGIDKLTDYNREFAKFADAINPLRIKRHTVISIHPVDYFTMSFGNSWSTCQTIDKGNNRGIDTEHSWTGCNSSGTMSYMLDETSFLFYTIDADYNGNTLELEPKINRCMFHYNDNQLLQGRVYPQTCDYGATELYKDIREIVQKVVADCLEVPNFWGINKKGTEACEEVTSSYGTHYRDYDNFDNCNVSVLKDDDRIHSIIEIGHDPICPCCGKTHERRRNIECYDCNNRD